MHNHLFVAISFSKAEINIQIMESGSRSDTTTPNGASPVSQNDSLEGENATKPYHTSVLDSTVWRCCSNKKDHPGCRTGEPRRHTGRFVPKHDGDCWDGCRGCDCCRATQWSCCGASRLADGCERVD